MFLCTSLMSVGADDFAQLFATKERYRCGMPLAGTVRPFCAPILFFLFFEKEKNRRCVRENSLHSVSG